MKIKTLLFAILALTVAATASQTASAKGKPRKKMMEKNVPGPAGCGLGYLVLGGHDMQILAYTLNYTGVQTSGITSGTSGCDAGSREAAMVDFIRLNREVVQNDMARGQGESLEALAKLSGCTDHSVFASGLKDKYSEIFPSSDSTAASAAQSIESVIEQNPQLSSTCPALT